MSDTQEQPKTFPVSVIVHLSEEMFSYLESSAKIRKISNSRLLSRLLKIALEDKLILSILDDDSKQPPKLPGERSNSHFYSRR